MKISFHRPTIALWSAVSVCLFCCLQTKSTYAEPKPEKLPKLHDLMEDVQKTNGIMLRGKRLSSKFVFRSNAKTYIEAAEKMTKLMELAGKVYLKNELLSEEIRNELAKPGNKELWASLLKKTQLETAKVVKAAKAKDLTAYKKTFATMTNACNACHDKFRDLD